MSFNEALIDRTCAVINERADWLTGLDQAIGDGDHGINMKRGFAAIAAQRDELAVMPLGDALMKAGMTLVTTVGGASGPLYGTLLMSLGKAIKAGGSIEDQLGSSIEAVKKRGKSDIGAKTMLDVLVPVHQALPADTAAAVRAAADDALAATKAMIATRGRASFLGERSKGHIDPGAASSNLLINAVCDVLEQKG